MISHVLGKGQGYPIGSKMPGAFDTVEDMLRAFVRDYRPRGSKPGPGKTPEPELMLITFTSTEVDCINRELQVDCLSLTAMGLIAGRLNEFLGLKKGFRGTPFDTNKDGLIFCPENMDWPGHVEGLMLETGPTLDENLQEVSHRVQWT